VKKIFLDSDIILDVLLGRPQFSLEATNIFELAYQKQIRILTSSVAFVNIHSFLDKFDRPKKFRLLNSLRLNISIISVDDKVIDQALKSGNNDFEDSVQYFAALSTGVDVIITRNKKDYSHSNIPVMTAGEFLNTLN